MVGVSDRTDRVVAPATSKAVTFYTPPWPLLAVVFIAFVVWRLARRSRLMPSVHVSITSRLAIARWLLLVVLALIGAVLAFALWYMPDF